MKILEVIQSLASGGAERLVTDLCNELSKTEDVTVLILKDVEHFYLPQLSPKVKVLEAKMPLGGSIRQLVQCCKWVNRIKPDVVHVHSHARYTMLLANLLYGRRYKFYLTIHSDVCDHYSHGWSGLQVRLSGFLGRCKFITISETNYRQFSTVHPKLKQRLIPNGRALPALTDKADDVRKEMQAYRTTADGTLFIHIARCHPCKDQMLLVESFNELIEEGEKLALVIIGAGFDSALGKSIAEKACNNIHFIGTKDNVYDYLACADAFCLSSKYEGMPITLIEAYLSGKSIISTPVCGATDIVKEGENGCLASGHTKEEYKETVRRFLKNKETISAQAEREKDSCPYAIDECAKRYLEWFKN
ncbi:MAG: glycosyltransferase [Bacteroidaceae bacterium]|nr:glycosyltransferase [Bacteroidaceae bacterium]